MFDRIKKAFARDGPNSERQPGPSDAREWASTHGLTFEGQPPGEAFTLSARVGGKPWRMQRTRPSRPFIRGEELRARAELDLGNEIAVLVMNRALKDALERQAYDRYTDTLQTTMDSSTPEEIRWLSMFDEVGWESAPDAFWDRYAILADQREHAQTWINESLCGLLLGWPQDGPNAQTPFTLMLVRGKAYLRMEYAPADLPTLAHATTIFVNACESALAGLAGKPPGKGR
ncbi:MAG TPA: hypothetical protein VLJ57_15325 [Burkholderiaceae bacterium]|nr:hypothetical protein [Burkholderiaceae bacterium]